MDADYWLGRWRGGRTGWHEPEGSALLREHVSRLRLGPGMRVLVPLCGKSHDLAVLARTGASVVGCELAESAVQAFFEEHGMRPTRTGEGARVVYAAGAIEIVVGDFFAETPASLGRFDAVLDRAARIALPPAMRPRFAEVIRTLAPGGRALVVLYEHDAPGDEPPFSVTVDEVRRAHPGANLAHLSTTEAFDRTGGLAQRGATFARETAIFLEGL